MKDRSKEKIAELLMDELLTRLSERGNLKRMLGEMTGHPIEQLVENLVSEFEQIVAGYQAVSQSVSSLTKSVASPQKDVRSGEHPADPDPEESPPPDDLHLEPPELSDTMIGEPESAVEDENEEGSAADTAGGPKEVQEKPEEVSDFRLRLEELARRVETEYLEKLRKEQGEQEEASPPADEPLTEAEQEPEKEQIRAVPKLAIEVGPGEGGRPSRIPYGIDDNEYLYVHGVMALPPGEAPCEYPFMLEEKGLDGKEFAFAIDSEDIRFFLSRLDQKEMSVSRKGVLLLGKAESLQLRGVHEGILNELRAHGIVLPMEFGTVARGKSDLLGLAGRYRAAIADSLEKIAATRWWTVTLSVLDARIVQLFDEGEQRRERDGRERSRVSYASATQQVKKYDVKLLEKLLQKEKRLAESVHQELTSVTERSEIQHMVGLGSGTSDEWKLILKATYLATGSFGYQRLSRSVTDLQYRHILFEPLLSVTGDIQDFSFHGK